MKLKSYITTGLFLIVLFVVDAIAYDYVPSVGVTKINYVENSWTGSGLAIYADDGIAGCGAADTEFYIDGTHQGFREMVSIALLAFTTQTDVQIIVEPGVCLSGNRTKVLAIRLFR